jgi:hypothetical protein
VKAVKPYVITMRMEFLVTVRNLLGLIEWKSILRNGSMLTLKLGVYDEEIPL